MHVAMLSWLPGRSVPPEGYGGIERMVATLCNELIRQGHQVTLIAPPGSWIEGATVFITKSFVEARNFLNDLKPDVIHDHSCWALESPARGHQLSSPTLSTTHVRDAIVHTRNVVYLSYAQRTHHSIQVDRKLDQSPVIRVPVDPQLQPKGLAKKDYLLYLGRVVPWKGVHYAAEVAQTLNRELVVAGPGGGEYLDSITKMDCVQYIGVVDGDVKHDLIEQAFAVMCLHNDGGIDWLEPGCGVVGEAGAFNTPVAALPNGCLYELVTTGINGWISDTPMDVANLMSYYTNGDPGQLAREKWNAEKIVKKYTTLYEMVADKFTWN